jgi:hypothetical protein
MKATEITSMDSQTKRYNFFMSGICINVINSVANRKSKMDEKDSKLVVGLGNPGKI